MKLQIELSEIDYEALLTRFLPQVAEQMRTSGNPLSAALSMPPALWKSVLRNLPQSRKDQMAAELLNANQKTLIELLEKLVREQGISAKIEKIQAEV